MGRPGVTEVMGERHVDPGLHLGQFMDEVLVHCVRCGAPGQVSARWEPYRWHARFRCTQCSLCLDTEGGGDSPSGRPARPRDPAVPRQRHGGPVMRGMGPAWVGPVRLSGRRPCGYCGHQWLTVNFGAPWRHGNLPGEKLVRCPICQRESPVSLSAYMDAGQAARDPHFGLPLRLVVPTRFGALWAFNLRHVAELEAYVGARVRTRQVHFSRALFSRVPRWLKQAHHRPEMLRALARLRGLLG